MAKLLYIQASPRTERSQSRAVADEFMRVYRETNPDDDIVTLNVFEADLGPFDGLRVQAKYVILHGKEHTAEELAAWKEVETRIEEFTSGDKYVFAVPMWNFGIPYRLKQYFDILVQPGYTFSFEPETGYAGLLTGRKAFVVYASGGEYPEGSEAAAFDMQKPYVQLILGFMGIADVKAVTVAPTLMGGPEVAAENLEAAKKTASELAKDF